MLTTHFGRAFLYGIKSKYGFYCGHMKLSDIMSFNNDYILKLMIGWFSFISFN